MINVKITLIFVLATTSAFGQSSQIDSVLNQITFKGDSIKTIFEWVTQNIEYDVEKMTLFHLNTNYLWYSDEDRISNTLKDHKGVCYDYALVFNTFCRKLGYQSYVVDGYTKSYNKISIVSHAWNVVKINGQWFCFDPTWTAGGIAEKEFIKSFDSTWYKVPPNEFILTHVPFDPIYQMKTHPVISQLKNTVSPINEYFNFEDSLKTDSNFEDDILSLEKTIYRVSKYSDKNTIVDEYIEFLKKTFEIKKENKAVLIFNKCVQNYNTYITYKNKFIKKRFKYRDLMAFLTEINEQLNTCESHSSKNAELHKQIEQLQNSIQKEINFMKIMTFSF